MAVYESGIDVSQYQGTIDWSQVAAAGKQFAIVRLGSSDDSGPFLDPDFSTNISGATAAGLKVGAYYYTYAQTEEQAITELETFLPALQGKVLQYPVFVDVEASSLESLGVSALTNLVQFEMNTLNQRGWYPGYYSYADFLENYLDTSQLAAYPLWVADYQNYVSYTGSYDLWQYSDTGSVAGIDGAVDLDYSYKNFVPILQSAGLNGYSSQPVMQALSGKLLYVYNSRCQYFNSPNVNDIVGFLPLGYYTAVAQSEGSFNGYVWVTFRYNGNVYWTALLSDRCSLVDSDACASVEAETPTADQ